MFSQAKHNRNEYSLTINKEFPQKRKQQQVQFLDKSEDPEHFEGRSTVKLNIEQISDEFNIDNKKVIKIKALLIFLKKTMPKVHI